MPMSQVHDAGSRASAALLGRVIDSLDDGVVVSDLDGRCLLSNPAARRLLATDFADVPAAEWTSIFGCLLPDMVTPYPPQDLPLTRALRGEVVSNLELFMVNLWAPQGVWLSVNATAIRDAHGEIEGGLVVLRDITRFKRKIQQIELLSNVVEATADAVIVTDRGGRIEYVNPAFETATGYARAEVLGCNPNILKSGAHTREFYVGLWRSLIEGRVFRGTFINRKKSGELFFTEQTITPIRRPGGGITHVVSVGKDVTQLRRAAERETTLLLARSVQQRLFPSHAPLVPGFDIFGATFVADVTGGDYHRGREVSPWELIARRPAAFQYIPPSGDIPPPPRLSPFSAGSSQTTASVLSSSEAMEAAFWSAERTTLVGSMTPASTRFS